MNLLHGKRGIFLKIFCILVILGVLVEAGLLTAVTVYAYRARSYSAKRADCLIVLGATVWPDGSLSQVLTHRMEKALEAYHAGCADTIIVCGAQGADEPVAEAIAMRNYLLQNGVPSSAIRVEDQSYNTIQNLENAQTIMAAESMNTAILVTSDYHVTRSLWIASKLRLPAQGIGAAPSDNFIALWSNRIRETISWVLYGLNHL